VLAVHPPDGQGEAVAAGQGVGVGAEDAGLVWDEGLVHAYRFGDVVNVLHRVSDAHEGGVSSVDYLIERSDDGNASAADARGGPGGRIDTRTYGRGQRAAVGVTDFDTRRSSPEGPPGAPEAVPTPPTRSTR
jgi:hypothetical protein